MNIGIIDIIILVAIGASAVWGLFKGFITQIVSILAFVLGVWCAFKFTDFASAYVKEMLSLTIEQDTLHIIMFVLILIVVMILSNLVGKAIEGIINLSMLGWMNSLLGFIFGGIKATVILSLVVYVVNYANSIFKAIPKDVLANSKGFTFLQEFHSNFFPFLEKFFS